MKNSIGTRSVVGSARGTGLVTAVISDSPWGNTLYVQSTHRRASDSNRTGRQRDHPLKTLRKALELCNNGDIILVGEGHAENFSEAIAVSKRGVQIVGLGVGQRRPTFTSNTLASAYMSVTGAGVRLSNLRFRCGFDALTRVLDLVASASVEDCEFGNVATTQPINVINAASGADGCQILRCRTGQNTAAAGTSAFIVVSGNRCVIRDCFIRGDYSVACITNTTGGKDNVIQGNLLENDNAVDVCINVGNVAATGWIADNYMRVATDAQVTWITQGGASLMQLAENYGVNNNQETAILEGTASI
jgi:hypothetical protein